MLKAMKYAACFGLLAGVGILLGCWIHGERANQPMVMSGVAFVRALPYGEQTVGATETIVFQLYERWARYKFDKKNKGKIQIDPAEKARQDALFNNGAGR
jgi:hypothetical protein